MTFTPNLGLVQMPELDNTASDRSTGALEMSVTKSRHTSHAKSNGKPKRKKYVKTLREPSRRKYAPISPALAAIALKVKKKPGQPLSRRTPPAGNGWAQRVGRGLAIHREKLGLSVPGAAKRFGIDQHLLYRIESGSLPQTTALHIDNVLAAFDLVIDDVLKLAPIK